VGAVGRWALDRANSKSLIRELQVHKEQVPNVDSSFQVSENNQLPPASVDEDQTENEIHEAIRLEAYDWPRLVFPPLKRSGHIILDGCTAEGVHEFHVPH
jgi:ribosomal protein RSM22 (predicted rRNA methylase)